MQNHNYCYHYCNHHNYYYHNYYNHNYYCNYYNSYTTQLRTVEGVLACYGRPASCQERLQQTWHSSGNLWEKEILPLKWILTPCRASPYSTNLSSKEGVRDVQPSNHYCNYYCYCYNSHTTQLRTVEGVSACYMLPASRQVRPQQKIIIIIMS